MYDTIIIGAGIAGLTAGIYTARSGLKTIILDGGSLGGQIAPVDVIENFPGFELISGYELSARIAEQAKKLGVEFCYKNADNINFSAQTKLVYVKNEVIETKTIIIATGARHKTADFAGEIKYTGKGISYCATCDGFFYKGKEVYVVGGGNSAVQGAIYLAGLAKKVNVVIRKDIFRCTRALSEQLLSLSNVEVYFNTEIISVHGNDLLKEITLKNNKTNETYSHRTEENFGVFVYVGNMPDTTMFKNKILLDENGYIVADDSCKTSVEGVFCAGDVRTKELRQLVTASSDGAVAAMQAERYINNYNPCHV